MSTINYMPGLKICLTSSCCTVLLQEERDRLRSEVSSLRANNDQTEQRAASLDHTISELRTEFDRLYDENRERESNAHRLRHESQSASAELNNCKQRIQTLESSLQEAQDRLMAASADAGSREQELEQELQHLQDRSREEVRLPALSTSVVQVHTTSCFVQLVSCTCNLHAITTGQPMHATHCHYWQHVTCIGVSCLHSLAYMNV